MEFVIYNLENYKMTKEEINNKALHTVLTDVNDVVKLLGTNQNYHFRAEKEGTYTFYADVDHIAISYEEYATRLTSFLSQHYNIKVEINDISYTKNKSKDGSYHIGIPSFHCSAMKMKEIMLNFKKQNLDLGTSIDTGIYGAKFFRYPNQLKESIKGTEHIIINGDLIDFVAEYIHPNSINIDDKKYIDNSKDKTKDKTKEKTKEKIQEEHKPNDNCNVSEVLKNIDHTKMEDRDRWLIFGTCLKKLGYGHDVFCQISSETGNHDPCTCESVYNSLDPNRIGDAEFILLSFATDGAFLGDRYSLNDIINFMKRKKYKSLREIETDIEELCGNLIYIFVQKSTKYIAIKHYYSKDNKTKIFDINKFREFASNHSNDKIQYSISNAKGEDRIIKISFPDLVNDVQKLKYNGYYIEPYHPFEENEIENRNRYVNIFSPMIAERLDNYDVSKINKILNHIKVVWANNDEFIYQYILSYFHRIIRTPWDRSQICMVINGEMGVGKSLVLEYMIKHIFGSITAQQTQGLKSICSKFQGWLENKLMILCEEPTSMTDLNFAEYTEKMKDFITSSRIEVEKKGIEKYTIDAFHNVIITCNHLKGIHVPNENERRYFIIECNKTYMGNHEYFNELVKILDNKSNMDILFNYLYDYNELVPLHPIPKTEPKKQLIKDSRTPVEKFLFDEEDHLLIDVNDKKMNLTELYLQFCEWSDRMGHNKNYRMKKESFNKEMSKYGVSKSAKINKESVRVFKFNDDIMEQLRNINKDYIGTASQMHPCLLD